MVLMVAAVLLVVLRLSNSLVTMARGHEKGAKKFHHKLAVGVWTVCLTCMTKVYIKAYQIFRPQVILCYYWLQRAMLADLVGQVTEVVVV